MIELLLTYKYIILIPLAIIEGPIIAVIAGFLVTLKVFNPFLVYLVMITGDVVGDGIIYSVGYFGKRFLPYFKITEEKIKNVKQYFQENHNKVIIVSKLAHGVGFTGLLAAGASHVSYKKYFKTCMLISIAQSFIMLTIGILFGNAYVVIEKYLNYYAAMASVIVLTILLFIFIRKYKLSIKI
jgi:membrane protein DedA with SNARE-associated domain